MIHLLKQSAKSFRGSKQRKTVPLMGSIGQYKEGLKIYNESQLHTPMRQGEEPSHIGSYLPDDEDKME